MSSRSPSVETQRPHTQLFLIVLIVALALALCASLAYGVRSVTFAEVFQALAGHTETASQAAAAARIPRTVTAVLAGSGLAVSGLALQAVTRNPLADPGIFGLLSGAALAVVVGIVVIDMTSISAQAVLSIIGAGLAATLAYAIASTGHRGVTPLKLALAGAITNAALMSGVQALLLRSERSLDAFRHWQVGDVASASWTMLLWIAPVIAVALVVAWLSAGAMNALSLGDDVATGLGFNVPRARLIIVTTSVVLAGLVTALCGPVGFIGLIVPHVCRFLFGVDHRWVVPLAAILGAVVVLAADTIGRLLVDHSEIQVGILTPILGVPVFIWIVRNYKVRSL